MAYQSRLTLVPLSSRGLSYEIKDEHAPCLIGRDKAARIRLSDQAVSRQHALLIYEGGDWYLQDQSKNGTLVNCQLVKEKRVKLCNGDHVCIGSLLNHRVVIVDCSSDETTVLTESHATIVADYPGDHLRVLNTGEVWIGQKRLDLSDQEIRLVQLLKAACGRHCSNNEIISHIFNGIGSSSNVQELVKRVRKKIKDQTGQDGKRYIEGYHDGYVLHTRPKPHPTEDGLRPGLGVRS